MLGNIFGDIEGTELGDLLGDIEGNRLGAVDDNDGSDDASSEGETDGDEVS